MFDFFEEKPAPQSDLNAITAPQPQTPHQILNIQGNISKLHKLNKLHHAFLVPSIYSLNEYQFIRQIMGEITQTALPSLSHPDVYLLQNQSTNPTNNDISVDDVRKLKHFALQSPLILQSKFIIINPITNLNKESCNSMLKILEEPPQNTFFFIIYHNIHTILPTIKSRSFTITVPNSMELYTECSNLKNPDDTQRIEEIAAKYRYNTEFLNYSSKINIIEIQNIVEKYLTSKVGETLTQILKIYAEQPQTTMFAIEELLVSKMKQTLNSEVLKKLFKVSDEILYLKKNTTPINISPKISLMTILSNISESINEK